MLTGQIYLCAWGFNGLSLGVDAVVCVVLSCLVSVFVGDVCGESLVTESYACGVDVGVAEVCVLEAGGIVYGEVVFAWTEVGVDFYGVPVCLGAVYAADVVVACA